VKFGLWTEDKTLGQDPETGSYRRGPNGRGHNILIVNKSIIFECKLKF
jgi:hypothetical protein